VLGQALLEQRKGFVQCLLDLIDIGARMLLVFLLRTQQGLPARLVLAAGAGAPWGIRLSPVEAALAMTLSSLFVLGNSLRLLGVGERLRGPENAAGAGA